MTRTQAENICQNQFPNVCACVVRSANGTYHVKLGLVPASAIYWNGVY